MATARKPKARETALRGTGGTDRGNCYFLPVSSASTFNDQRWDSLVKLLGDSKMLTPDHASENSMKLDFLINYLALSDVPNYLPNSFIRLVV